MHTSARLADDDPRRKSCPDPKLWETTARSDVTQGIQVGSMQLAYTMYIPARRLRHQQPLCANRSVFQAGDKLFSVSVLSEISYYVSQDDR